MGGRSFVRITALALAAVALCAALAAPPAVASEEAETSEPDTITTVLHPGWNMVGWVGPETPASKLFEELPALAGIYAWDNEAGGYQHRARPVVHLLDPLMLTPGQGLWLYLGGEAPFEWTREASEDSVLLELRAGRNLVAWAGRDGTPIDEAVERFGERLVHVWGWNAEASQYRLYHPHAASNSLAELDHGDALLVELAEDARWWQSGTAPPPVVFVGEFTDERRSEIEESVDGVRAVFAERWGVEAAPTIYVGDLESITPTYRRIRGREPPDRHCANHSRGIIFFFSKPLCIADHSVPHEYFHALQNSLSGAGYYDVPKWLLEGSAVYAEAVHAALRSDELTVPEHLDRRESRAASQLRASALPRLAEIGAFDDFHALHDSIGYRVGFIAARWLVDNSSEESMIGFFTAVAESARWQDAFESAFGVVVDEFYKQFEAYLGEVAPPLPHLTDGREGPALVFVGDVPADTAGAVRAEFDAVRNHFAQEFDAGTADYTLYVGDDPDALTDTYARVTGKQPPETVCEVAPSFGSAILSLDCHAAAPHRLDYLHFIAVRERLAPWSAVPSTPEGFSRWGPEWLSRGSVTYVQHAYRVARGHEVLEISREREARRARHTSRLLSSTSTWDGFNTNYWQSLALGFLALEILGERAGDAALFEYYRLLPDSESWTEAFEVAFGITVGDFYEEFEEYRAEVAPPLPHLTDDSDDQVLVFVDDVPADTSETQYARSSTRCATTSRRSLQAGTADYTLYIGPDSEVVGGHPYARVTGKAAAGDRSASWAPVVRRGDPQPRLPRCRALSDSTTFTSSPSASVWRLGTPYRPLRQGSIGGALNGSTGAR